MCDKPEHPRHFGGSARRNFLKATSAATALGLVGTGLFTGSARADALSKAQRDNMTLEAHGAIKIAGAMYNLETGAVEFFG